MAEPVKGKHSGPKEAVLAFAQAKGSKRYDQVVGFVDQLYAQNIFDAFMICAQSANETTNWTDSAWELRLNPGGIGITDDQDFGYGFKSGADAAKAMLIHHCAYTDTTIPAEWATWKALDPRYDPAVQLRMQRGTIVSWDQYGNGMWATDPNYYGAISERAAAIRTFITGGGGVVVTPRIIDKWLHVAQDGWPAVERRYVGRGGMQPKIIVLHIQEGFNMGSWEWFHQTSASCTVMIAKNGDIWRLVPESDAPWTNGDVNNPTALGREMLNSYGADPNYYTLSIETEGFTGEWPKPQVQLDSVVWQIQQWMNRYSIPVHRVLRHADINQVSRPNCPGNTYYNYVISKLTNTTDSGYAQPAVVEVNGVAWDGTKDVTVNGHVFHADTKTVKTTIPANARQFASTGSPTTRARIEAGTTFGVLGWVEGDDVSGERRWWITKNYSRVWVGATAEKPTPPVVYVPPVEGMQMVGKQTYYPCNIECVLVRDTNVRKGESGTADIVRLGKKGETFTATFYTVGTRLRNELLWYVVDGTPASGEFISASATDKRPS